MFRSYGRSTRQFSARNLPRALVIVAILLGSVALLGPLARKYSIVKESDLKVFTGFVQRASTRDRNGLIRIRVETSDGPHDFLAEDTSHYQEMMNLQPGDYVTARVQRMPGEYHIWELTHDGVTIESYQDMYSFSTRELERGTTLALWTWLLCSILLVVAIGLRMYFGAWSETTQQATSGDPESSPWDR